MKNQKLIYYETIIILSWYFSSFADADESLHVNLARGKMELWSHLVLKIVLNCFARNVAMSSSWVTW